MRTIQKDHLRRRACSPVSYSNTATTGSANQLEHRSDTGCPRDPVQPRIETTHLGHFAVGPDSELGEDPKIAYKRVETVDTAPAREPEIALTGNVRQPAGFRLPNSHPAVSRLGVFVWQLP